MQLAILPRFGGERVCDNMQVRTDFLDRMVWQEVRALLEEPQRLEQEYQRRLQASDGDDKDLVAIQTQIVKVQKGIARLIDSYAEGFLEKQEFKPRISRLRQRLRDLETQEQAIADEQARQTELRLVIAHLDNFAATVRDNLDKADWLTKRELIRTLVRRVEIGKDDVQVVFRVPPIPFDSGPDGARLQHCWWRAVADTGEPAVGRSGPGTRAAGALLLSLRGRLQYLRENTSSRGAGAGLYRHLLGRTPTPPGEPVQKCGSLRGRTPILGVSPLAWRATGVSTPEHPTHQAADSGHHAPQSRGGV
jgi:hypothetical protein